MSNFLKSAIIAGAFTGSLVLAGTAHASPLAGSAATAAVPQAGVGAAVEKVHRRRYRHRHRRRRGGVYLGLPYLGFSYGYRPRYYRPYYGYGYRPRYYRPRYYGYRRYRGYRPYYGGSSYPYAPMYGYGK